MFLPFDRPLPNSLDLNAILTNEGKNRDGNDVVSGHVDHKKEKTTRSAMQWGERRVTMDEQERCTRWEGLMRDGTSGEESREKEPREANGTEGRRH